MGRDVLQHSRGESEYAFEPACPLGIKLAGVHWWFKSRSHGAELTAGYYNTRERDGYADVMSLLASHKARASFTCVEMRDCEHPPEARCSPQGMCLPYSCGLSCTLLGLDCVAAAVGLAYSGSMRAWLWPPDIPDRSSLCQLVNEDCMPCRNRSSTCRVVV